MYTYKTDIDKSSVLAGFNLWRIDVQLSYVWLFPYVQLVTQRLKKILASICSLKYNGTQLADLYFNIKPYKIDEYINISS